ncbi:MAG: 3-phosphoshikimate 1-carboxyvinyltransferase [Deltaproteobacteria bacterium]|nr:3-phosphoshikimate 1-carboxyvinyltransferase [Deltaproteobacteria bacterium]
MTRPHLALRAPSSKSQTQRAILIAALTPGRSILHHPLDCDDSRHLKACLSALGTKLIEDGERLEIRGGPLRAPSSPLDCGDGGTTLRFLLPTSLLLKGSVVFDGSARLRERPLTPLLEALESLGASIEHLGQPGRIPVRISPPETAGRRVSIDASETSQFASGLLLTGPRLPNGLELQAEVAVSAPYLDMTLDAMRCRGASVERNPHGYSVHKGAYEAGEHSIEGDWSSAAFLLVGARIAGLDLHLVNADPSSAQGDKVIVTQLRELDEPRPHTFDLTHCPDLIAPLAIAAALAAEPTRIVGAAHARLKESDRLGTLAEGLRAVGVNALETQDGLELRPGGTLRPGVVRTRRDHRMAMAFALLSLREPGIDVDDRDCVSKSYPSFWEDLEKMRAHHHSAYRTHP